MYWVMRRVPLWRLTCRHAAEAPHLRRASATPRTAAGSSPWHGRARRGEPRAVPERVRLRRPTCSRRRPTATCGRGSAGLGADRRARRRTCSTWCSVSSAPGPTRTCRGSRRRMPGCSGRRSASRTRTRSTSTGAAAQDLRRGRASRARPLVPLPDQQVAQQRDELAGRPARAAARRGHGGSARRIGAAAHGACRRSRAGLDEPAPLGAARQAVPAAGHHDPRLRLVPRLGRRHALPRGDGRGELSRSSGRTIPTRGSAAMAPVGGRAARDAATGAAAAASDGPRHGRPVPQQELRQARHLAEHPPSEGAGRSPRTDAASAMSSPRGSRPACCSASGSATTC